MVSKNTKTDKLTGNKKFAKRDTSYSSLWLYNRDADMNSEHFKDSFVNFYDDKELLSEFNPTVAKNIISFWSEPGDIVLDPFSGRTRALVSYAMNRKYIGFEVSKDVVNYMNKRFNDLDLYNDDNFNVEIINDDCYNVNTHKHGLKSDLVFSCPPYWNLEQYESCDGQLSDEKDYNQFLQMLKVRLLKSFATLKPGGHMCMVVGDFRKNKNYVTFHSDLIQNMKDVDDAKLHDVIAIQNLPFASAAFYFGSRKKHKYTAKAHEYLLVWKKKGGPKGEQPFQLQDIQDRDITDMQRKAAENGGKCLSKEYVNMTTKLLWECSEGHQWWAKPTLIISRGQWCPRCRRKNSGVPKKDFNVFRKTAEDNSGKLLSTPDEYENMNSKLLWQCKYGHEWRASINSVYYSGRWCPHCRVGYWENYCRYVMEELSGSSFEKVKPEWIVNPKSGSRLELDGYNDDLKLAFEYNGKQHYDDSVFNNDGSLPEQQYRDDYKKQMCEQRGVSLLIFDYTMSERQIIDSAKKMLETKGVKLNNINPDNYRSYNYTRHAKFKDKVESLGYELLSNYKGRTTPVQIKCAQGHVLTIEPRSVDRNKGCPVCNRYRKHDNDTINKLCLQQGFELLQKDGSLGERFEVECTSCSRVIKTRHSDVTNNRLSCVKL